MCVASADSDFVPSLSQLRGVLVGAFEHVAVVSFHGREIFLKPGEILSRAFSRDAGEDMIDAEEKSALGEIHQQRYHIVAPPQELRMLPLA